MSDAFGIAIVTGLVTAVPLITGQILMQFISAAWHILKGRSMIQLPDNHKIDRRLNKVEDLLRRQAAVIACSNQNAPSSFYAIT